MRNLILPLSTLTATIIGVGLFGLPYVASKIGFFPILIYFAVLALVSILMHQIFGEICLRTEKCHRLPGYAQKYLGESAKWISAASTGIGLFGSNLAYLVVGSIFLTDLLGPLLGGNQLIYASIYFLLGSVLCFFGYRSVSRSELAGLIIIMLAGTFIFISSLPKIDISNFMTFDLSTINLILPYGVILFSLSGMSIVPEIKDALKVDRQSLKNILAAGVIFAAAFYIIFVFFTLGVTGARTTSEAMTGLSQALGYRIMIAGFILGLFTTFTSYISINLTIKKIFSFDLKFPPFLSWLIAVGVPFVLYLLGVNDFIRIIGFVGAVTMGIDSIMIFLIYLKAKKMGDRVPEYEVGISKILIYLLGLMFIFGVIADLYLNLK